MAYASASDVAALTQNLLPPDTNFSTSSSPTLTEVNTWLSSGCAIIETQLSAAGYSIPILATAGIYTWIRDINAFYAVAMAENSRTNMVLSAGERTRGQFYEKMFWDHLSRFAKFDLTRQGVGRTTTGTMYGGGITKSDKKSYEEDTNRVKPRFKRNQFGFPGGIRPDSYTLDEDETE